MITLHRLLCCCCCCCCCYACTRRSIPRDEVKAGQKLAKPALRERINLLSLRRRRTVRFRKTVNAFRNLQYKGGEGSGVTTK
uniref:Putative secreted protein n=1 Tax=Anopheles darlingi TaxID=43151 RepID=A0A2M4D6Q0_ANODA